MGFERGAGDRSIPIGTTVGWNDFTRWVRTLDPKTYPLLTILAIEGWTNQPHAIAAEIDEAVGDPSAGDRKDSVVETAAGVAVTMEDLEPDQVAYLGNGCG